MPWRKLGPALMAGNTAVLKPASQTPAVGEAVMQILIEAGIPAGVVQLVTGSGGVKESGFGLPEAGSTGIQFFQDEKAVYVRKRDSLP